MSHPLAGPVVRRYIRMRIRIMRHHLQRTCRESSRLRRGTAQCADNEAKSYQMKREGTGFQSVQYFAVELRTSYLLDQFSPYLQPKEPETWTQQWEMTGLLSWSTFRLAVRVNAQQRNIDHNQRWAWAKKAHKLKTRVKIDRKSHHRILHVQPLPDQTEAGYGRRIQVVCQ